MDLAGEEVAFERILDGSISGLVALIVVANAKVAFKERTSLLLGEAVGAHAEEVISRQREA